jgi:hypothetical protein
LVVVTVVLILVTAALTLRRRKASSRTYGFKEGLMGLLDKAPWMRGRKIVWNVFVTTRGFLSTVEGQGSYATKDEAKSVARQFRRLGYSVKVEAQNVPEEFVPQPIEP